MCRSDNLINPALWRSFIIYRYDMCIDDVWSEASRRGRRRSWLARERMLCNIVYLWIVFSILPTEKKRRKRGGGGGERFRGSVYILISRYNFLLYSGSCGVWRDLRIICELYEWHKMRSLLSLRIHVYFVPSHGAFAKDSQVCKLARLYTDERHSIT